MSVACTSCGHLNPEGQVRCAKCGEPAPGASAARAVEARAPTREQNAEDPADAAEPAVPKGTFASVAPQPPSVAGTRPEGSQEPRLAAAPREPGDSPKGAAQSSSQRIKQVRAATRPPFLASESLREDLSPIAPGKELMIYTLQLAGVLGALGSVLVAYDHWVGWLCALTCVALAVLSRLELDYQRRALFVAVLAGVALCAASAGRVALGASTDGPLLVVACSLLPAALLFRSWYRGARAARASVGLTVVLAFAWAGLTSHRGLLALGFTWQSWLPALAWSLFCILCLLSLLAFMGDETTGGCHVWALGISLWFGLFACLRFAIERDSYGPDARAAAASLGLTEAALASALAIALAQLAARAYVARSRLMPNVS